VDICTSCGVSYQRNIKWCLPLMKACALSGRLQHMLRCVESQGRGTAADLIIILLVSKTQLPGILRDPIHTKQEGQRVSMSRTHTEQSQVLKLRQALMNRGCNGEREQLLWKLCYMPLTCLFNSFKDSRHLKSLAYCIHTWYVNELTCFMRGHVHIHSPKRL